MVGIRILQIIIIFIIVGVIIYLLRLSSTLNMENRIAKYTIPSKKEELSLLDNIHNIIQKIIKKISQLLSKSTIISKYGDHYNKYITYEEKEEKSGLDYVATKILICFGFLILSLITLAFQKIKYNLLLVLIVIIISFFIPDIILTIKFNQKRKQIEDDLLKAIVVMNNAFQSGRNIMQAIEVVKTELDGPIKDEFQKIYLDMSYGLSLDVVFARFYDRVKLEDAKYITSSLTLLNKTGGDIVKVFSLIEKSFLAKKNLKNELKSLTSSSRFVFKMLVFLPLIFTLLIFILNPTYFNPLFNNPLGLLILLTIIILYILYIFIIKKVLEVHF